jgi:zinc protease
MLIGLRSSREDPGHIASEAFYGALYQDHPYASPPDGTEDSINLLDREAVVAFHRRYYVARNAVIAIVGDIDTAGARRLAENLSAALPEGGRAPALPIPPRVTEAREVRIPFKSKQSHLLVGASGMARRDEDYYALYVANHSFGGSGFTSRLVDEIREKRGLAYSAYSYFLPMARPGPFIMGLQTRSDQVEEALGLVRYSYQEFVTNGVTSQELVSSKRNVTGGAPLRVDSNSKKLGYLAMIGFYDLPLDYLAAFNSRIEAVEGEAIVNALQRRLGEQKLITVIVGPDS